MVIAAVAGCVSGVVEDSVLDALGEEAQAVGGLGGSFIEIGSLVADVLARVL